MDVKYLVFDVVCCGHFGHLFDANLGKLHQFLKHSFANVTDKIFIFGTRTRVKDLRQPVLAYKQY
jgi:hypothetical protein